MTQTRAARTRVLLPTIVAAAMLAVSLPTIGNSAEAAADYITIAAGDLTVSFVNNRPWGKEHAAGYNGLASMTHRQCNENVFVPAYAGFNLEHIFGGDRLEDLFEPRHHPMTLVQISTTSVELRQNRTPLSALESTTRFTVVPPHYVDVEFQCRIGNAKFYRHGYAGAFWASYIHGPEDKSVHFLGVGPKDATPRWISAFSETHGVASTHLAVGDPGDLFFAPDFNATLASHFSGFRFSEPFFYGRFRNMALVYMFDRSEGIRFSQSPTGGGEKNPAWDFQFLVRSFQTNRPYGYCARLVYKPFISRQDVLKEFRRWRGQVRP